MSQPVKNFVTVGEQFGRLTVVVPEGPRLYANPEKFRAGLRSAIVQCGCGGRPFPVAISGLKRGTTKSCGCLRREATRQRAQLRHDATARVRREYIKRLERENEQLRQRLRDLVQGSYIQR